MNSSAQKTILIALGGNALSAPQGDGDIQEQRDAIRKCAQEIVRIVKAGWSVVLTHGNGPQIGRLLLQQDAAKEITQPLPFDVCGAMTQGQIGYLLQQGLREALRAESLDTSVVTLLTQVSVDPDDPAFQNPTKPIGPFAAEPEAEELTRVRKFTMKRLGSGARAYRRVVPSPRPIHIVELDSIKSLVAAGHLVIACGGGGVPVVAGNGCLRGVDAVIDKDLASERLASELGVEVLLILTDVGNVLIHYGKPQQRALKRVTVAEMKEHLDGGEFPPGSMGPKIEAALRFLDHGGRRVIITSLERATEALAGRAGTEIVH